MTPEEKFNQEIWWILQEIRKEQLSTLKGEKVEFSLRLPPKQSKKIDDSIPSADTQRKLLYKLKEWKAVDLEVKLDPIFGNDLFNPTNRFDLAIHQLKFDELYRLYEDGIAYQEDGKGKSTTTPKNPPIIKSKTLELIAQIIGDIDTGTNLITFLTNCGVDSKLIEYPQTKWRMVNAVLQMLATSENPKDFRILYKIIEEACHPLTHEGNEEKAKEITNKFNKLLKYDDIYLEDGTLFIKAKYDGSISDDWISSDGKVIEPEVYLTIPQDIAKLYVFWNELIRMTKFYLSNPNKQSDELNEIYFELIGEIEDILKNKQCGQLHSRYIRPFKNLIGCEYEAMKIDKKTEDILINLYAFSGEITCTSLPTKEFVKDAKKESKNLLDKIEVYIKNHAPASEVIKEKITVPQPIPIHIIGGKMEIEGLQDGLKAITTTKQDNKHKFPHKLPAGTIWENFTIKFLNDEDVFIQIKQFKHYANYKEMGFIGRGTNPSPSEAWTFLKVLAKVNGELTLKDPEARDKYKKQKELLAKSLQDYFSLDYDPFYPYHSSSEKSGRSYKIKITLIPPLNQNKREAISEDKDDLGVKDYLDEQNPQVHEDK